MKRALVSCAAFAILGVVACSSGSNPTLAPGVSALDGGRSERGATLPPDTRPPASEAGVATPDSRDTGVDVPLGRDAGTGAIDTAPPSKVIVAILSPASAPSIDGGAVGATVIASTDRFAPKVAIEVQSQGGDPTLDIMSTVKAVLVADKTTSTAASVTLNQTQNTLVPESGSRTYVYSDTPFDLGKVSGGFYDLRVTATTMGGVSGTASVRIYIDAGPSIVILQPSDGVYVKGSVLVSAVVTDERAGVALVEFAVGKFQIAPSAITNSGSQYTLTIDFDSFNPPLDGKQIVTVSATNGNGIDSSASRSFIVDRNGPTIGNTKPAAGGLIGTIITIEATADDPAGVMESSVIAVVAHGDVSFEVALVKDSSGLYRGVFDTTKLPVHTIFPSISFRAQDVLGNESSVGYLLSLDNTPPIMDLDPPATFRLVKKDDGTCSWPFDPVGPDAIDDGSMVTQLFDIRARIEDEGNTPITGTADFVPIAAVDPNTVKVFILDETSLPLVVDTSDPPDGICDDINPDLTPSVSPQSSKDAQLFDMVSMPANAGAGDFTPEPGSSCSGKADKPPGALCETTYSELKNRVMTYSLGYSSGLPSIWTIKPIVGDGLQCAGRQFDASNNVRDGWACVAVKASDMVGNKQVSRPIRICVTATPGSTACTAVSSSGADIASVSLPSTVGGNVVVATKTPLLGSAGAAITKGDTLVFTNVSPVEIAFLNGAHAVEPQGSAGTQFIVTDARAVPIELWATAVASADGGEGGPIFVGTAGVLLKDGAPIQITGVTLPVGSGGPVILVSKGSKSGANSQTWDIENIQANSFTLKGSMVTLTGFATPASVLPNCTGTVVKQAAGQPAKVDATIPCKPLKSFSAYEALFI
jgi:hypothetical protein